MEAKGITRDVSGALAQAGTLIDPNAAIVGTIKLNELYDKQALHAGAK